MREVRDEKDKFIWRCANLLKAACDLFRSLNKITDSLISVTTKIPANGFWKTHNTSLGSMPLEAFSGSRVLLELASLF